jgi:signal transduction histidine kinase
MTSALQQRFASERHNIADRWFRAIATTGVASYRPAEIRARLQKLTDMMIEAAVSDPFNGTHARSIGVSLARLRSLNAQTLAATLRVIGTGLTAPLSRDEVVALQPRLVELMAEVAGAYYAASRDIILQEQEEVRSALFATQQQAEAADEARAIAEASARARSDVLSHVAHDLRSPLTSIKGQTDLIADRVQRETPSTDWLRLRMNSIRASTQRMQGMIGELLDASRLQVGEQLELNPRQVDLVDLVKRVAQSTEMIGRTVKVDVESGPIEAFVDIARLERVLHNLLNNAAKYSPSQTAIELSLSQDSERVQLIVRDHGVGIPADELPLVTTPFYRASTARAVPGTGLGLAGVKAIIEQHGGELAIESVMGEGTCVVIHLPRLQ